MADLGAVGRNIMPLDEPFIGGTISGTVLDADGNPAVRTVLFLNRDTRTLENAISSKADGTYVQNFPPTNSSQERIVICLDDDAGSLENDLIHRTFPV